MLVNNDIFFLSLLVETRTFSVNFTIFGKPENSQRGLKNISIKKLKFTHEILTRRESKDSQMCLAVCVAFYANARHAILLPHERDENSAWRDQAASAKEASLGNLVIYIAPFCSVLNK